MKPNIRKLFVVWVVFALLAAACAAPAPPTPTPSPLDLVQVFQEAYNAHDADAVLALLSDDPQMSFGAFSLAPVGAKAVRNVLEFQFATNPRLELSECSMVEGVVSCKMADTDDCVPAAVGAIHYDARFVFTEGKISLVYGQLSTGEAGWENLLMPIFQGAWTTDNFADDFATMLSDDGDWRKFHDGEASGTHSPSEMGQALDRLCKGYAEATR